jgi:MSHA biogenesis protein MshJ
MSGSPAASAGIGANWKAWSAAFAARARREKVIIGIAALAVVFALADHLWITPATKRLAAEQKALETKNNELQQVVAQANALIEQARQRDDQVAAALTAAKQDVGTVSTQLAEFERTLVPARRMTEFLRGLMPESSVEVVALKTLPPSPLVQRPLAKDGKDGKEADVAAKAVAAKQPNLYKHGVEITLAGSYPALLGYLARLERAPQKVLWGRLDLRVEKHPRSELKLVLYTLSLDPAWLAV